MKSVILFLFVTLSLQVSSQLNHFVIASAGENFQTTFFELDFTIGEVVIQDFPQSQIILLQGFHQPGNEGDEDNIQSAYQEGMLIYPNPTNGTITIKVPLNNDIVAANIYDSRGALCRSENIESDLNQINLSDLSSGLYLLSLLNEELKVIYQHNIIIQQ